MVNFQPLKGYIIYCLDKLIKQHRLSSPFLDVGCGIGDISRFAALKGWQGKAIDFSDAAVKAAKRNLSVLRGIIVEKKSLFQETGKYKTIFFIDALEHIEDDRAALEKASFLLESGGYLILSVPSNPGPEWSWDDHFYGHYRRYTADEIREKLLSAGLKPLVFWDYTYPVFWLMRRVYTRLKSPPENINESKDTRSMESSLVNAWDMPFCSAFLSQKFILWSLVYKIQFKYFKDKLGKGHEFIVLAKKLNERKA